MCFETSVRINRTYDKATVKSNVARIVGDMEVIHKFINVRENLREGDGVDESEGAEGGQLQLWDWFWHSLFDFSGFEIELVVQERAGFINRGARVHCCHWQDGERRGG
jgi:hypothetical protein